jgi:hypothetical protein
MTTAFTQADRRLKSPFRTARTGRRDAQAEKFSTDGTGYAIYRRVFKFVGDSIFVDPASRGEFWIALDDETGRPVNVIHGAPGLAIRDMPFATVSVYFRAFGDVEVSLALTSKADFKFGNIESVGHFVTTTATTSLVAVGVGNGTQYEVPSPFAAVETPVYGSATVYTASAITGSALVTFGYATAGDTPTLAPDLARVIGAEHITGAGAFHMPLGDTAPAPGESLFMVVSPTATYTGAIDAVISCRSDGRAI